MLKLHLIFGISLLFIQVHLGQSLHPNIVIDDQFSPEEPSICFHSKDIKNMVVGTNLNHVFQSKDSGLSWHKISVKSTQGIWGDPVIACDTNGHFYFLHLSNNPNGSWIDRIVCQKSIDNGINWSDGSYFGLNGRKAQDKHWVVIDPTTNILHVTWTQFDKYGSKKASDKSCIRYTNSSDGGLNWKEPIVLSQTSGDCIDSDSTTEGAVPAIGPNGELYVSWAGPDGLVFDRSMDGGTTWLETDIKVDPMPGGWNYEIPGIYRSNGLPITKCDISDGPYRGTIYINWSDQRMGKNDTDIWIARSSDQGKSWSDPIRVNNDSAGSHQFLTWMDIDPLTGYIYIVFYDRRDHQGEGTDVYMARSTDGGKHFTNIKISEQPFYPNKTVFFGDYNNIQVKGDVVRPVWTRLDDKKLSVLTAIVDTQHFNLQSIIDQSTDQLAILNQKSIIYFSTGQFAKSKSLKAVVKGIDQMNRKKKHGMRIYKGSTMIHVLSDQTIRFDPKEIILKRGLRKLHVYKIH